MSFLSGLFGGGGKSEAFDKKYNARLATLMEKSDQRAGEMFDFWRNDYMPYQSAMMWANKELISPQLGLEKERISKETAAQIYDRALLEPKYGLAKAQIDAAYGLLPRQTALAGAKINSEMRLLPQQTELTSAQIGSAMELLPQQTALESATIADKMGIMRERRPVRQAFYRAALHGLDPQAQANRAAADAAHAFAGSSAVLSRNAARMGINPNSGRFAAMNNANAIQRAQAIGGARTQGRVQGEKETFARLQSAMGMGRAG